MEFDLRRESNRIRYPLAIGSELGRRWVDGELPPGDLGRLAWSYGQHIDLTVILGFTGYGDTLGVIVSGLARVRDMEIVNGTLLGFEPPDEYRVWFVVQHVITERQDDYACPRLYAWARPIHPHVSYHDGTYTACINSDWNYPITDALRTGNYAVAAKTFLTALRHLNMENFYSQFCEAQRATKCVRCGEMFAATTENCVVIAVQGTMKRTGYCANCREHYEPPPPEAEDPELEPRQQGQEEEADGYIPY
jgi:hypothetical protein